MARRITLLHNPGAGHEQYSRRRLVECFTARGFDVAYVDTKRDDLDLALADPGDAVIVGGGDGTVGTACKKLAGRGIPVGILPLGTANNIATSLGIHGEPEKIIARLDLSAACPFDVGVVRGPHGESLFLESTGFGLLPRLIRVHESSGKESSREEELQDALHEELDIVAKYEPRHCKLELDGDRVEGRFLLVEVMNIPLAGPNALLAPLADWGDGVFDVALVPEEARDAFADLLRNVSAEDLPPGLTVRRAKHVTIDWGGPHYHIDDEPHRGEAPVRLSVEVIPAALRLLMPDR